MHEKGEHHPVSQHIGEFVFGPCLGTMPQISANHWEFVFLHGEIASVHCGQLFTIPSKID